MYAHCNEGLAEIEVDCGACRGRGVDRKGFDCLDCDGYGTVILG